MSLKDKLKSASWIVGFPVVSYLAASGMDALSKSIPYHQSLENPFTPLKGLFFVVYFSAMAETIYLNNKKNRK